MEPSAREFAAIIRSLDRLETYDGGDQGLLNAVLRGQRGGPGQLPYRYNRFPHEELNALSDPSTGAFDIRDASVLHFAGLKPWNNRAKFGPQAIRAFDRAMADVGGGETLAFCRSGTRSIVLRSYAAARAGKPVSEIIAEAAAAGYDIAGHAPALEALGGGE